MSDDEIRDIARRSRMVGYAGFDALAVVCDEVLRLRKMVSRDCVTPCACCGVMLSWEFAGDGTNCLEVATGNDHTCSVGRMEDAPPGTYRHLERENARLRADRDAALEREMQAVRERDAAVAEAVRVERARATLLCEKKAARYRQREAEVFSECDTDATVAIVCEALADAIRRGE